MAAAAGFVKQSAALLTGNGLPTPLRQLLARKSFQARHYLRTC
jgi:hypothetical protein